MKAHNTLLVLYLVMLAPFVSADLVLVANPSSGIEHLTKSEIINIYLGRYRRLSTGSTAVPIDLAENSGNAENKAIFYRQLVNKNLAEINAYWSRLVFSGKTRPPKQVSNIEEALEFVANNPNALAYIDRSAVNSQVIIVYEWPDS
jgi:ABC-type phosphate transport system substrate-binding protein